MFFNIILNTLPTCIKVTLPSGVNVRKMIFNSNCFNFLASDKTKYITDQILGVDGGFLSADIIHGSKKDD